MASFDRDQHIPIEDLSAYADGEYLSAAERSQIEQHLAVCQECREELESLRAVSTLLADLPEPELPRSFRLTHDDVSPVVPAEMVEVHPWILRHQSLFRYSGLAAALLLVVLVTIDLLPRDTEETAELFTTQETVDEADEPVDEPGIMMADDADADVEEFPEAEMDVEEEAVEEEAAEEPSDEIVLDDEDAPEDHPAVDADAEDADHPAAEAEPEMERDDVATRVAVEDADEGLSTLQLAALAVGLVAVILLLMGFVIPRWWSSASRER